MDVELEAVEMELRAVFPLEGNYGIKPGAGVAMERLDYLVEVQSSAPRERVLELMEEAERHCFASNSLQEAVEVVPGVRLNGQELPFNPPPELGRG